MKFAEMSRLTLVFLTSAFIAPTPPRSPPDMPSTSSIIRHVLWVIATPETVVDCQRGGQRDEREYQQASKKARARRTPVPFIQPSTEVLSMLVPPWRIELVHQKQAGRGYELGPLLL